MKIVRLESIEESIHSDDKSYLKIHALRSGGGFNRLGTQVDSKEKLIELYIYTPPYSMWDQTFC